MTWLVKTVSELPDLRATAHIQFRPALLTLNVSWAGKQGSSKGLSASLNSLLKAPLRTANEGASDHKILVLRVTALE